MDSNMVELHNVSKKLGKKQVLNNISLSISKGEVAGIVGTNGSGKTTLLRLAVGLMYPDAGEIYVADKKVRPGLIGELPIDIGALVEAPTFLPQYSGMKNLSMLAGIQEKIDDKMIRETIELVGLDPDSRKKVRSYSQGMRQRLGIAQAIMETPKVLLLDEPTNGLDQSGREIFSDIIHQQIQQNAAIILISHQQNEIDSYCDKVYELNNGSLQIIRKRRERKWTILVKSLEEIESLYRILPSFSMKDREKDFPTGIFTGDWESEEDLLAFLKGKGIHPQDVRREN